MKMKKKKLLIILLFILLIIISVLSLFVGSSNMKVIEVINALFFKGNDSFIRIIYKIRIPRIIAAIVAGGGLSIAGLIMQTTLNNYMASPQTLGVSNAAVFGANLSIIIFAGGYFISSNNNASFFTNSNPFSTSFMAFLFAILSTFLILLLCKSNEFSPNFVILLGIAMGSLFNALTTLLQYYATDVGLAAAVVWNFGDLGRATYLTDIIMFVVLFISIVFFSLNSWRYNALLSGDNVAKSLGINVKLFRFISLLLASLITATCVSFLGIIGFVGLISPHICRKIVGNDHRYLIPASLLSGSILLLLADMLSRFINNGVSLPVGSITTLLGLPFFIFIIFKKRGSENA